MLDILTALQDLNSHHGPSGDEAEVAQAIETLAKPYADEILRDTMGNLLVHRRGDGPRVMFAAHMDSIGFIVTHIDEKGFLRFGRLGGLHTAACLNTPVRFKNGIKGVVALDCAVEEAKMTLNDLYIDIGAKDREQAESMVQIGDTAVFDAPTAALGDRISSPYLDDRISCVALLMALERLQARKNDLWFVFTVQEELGLRGAGPAAFYLEPKYGIAVDVTLADDELNAKHGGSSVLGHGAAVKVMDGSVLCHPQIVSALCTLAEKRGISFQRDIIRAGGTDAGAIHKSRGGVYTGGISVPCRYIHSPVEMADPADVEACAALIAAFAESDLD